MAYILLITHEHIGKPMLKIAGAIVGEPLTHAGCIEVPMDTDREAILLRAQQQIEQHGDTLVLTDIFGSTPGNIAAALARHSDCRAISGLNMPMLLRAINYHNRPLQELADRAREGGINGIVCYEQPL